MGLMQRVVGLFEEVSVKAQDREIVSFGDHTYTLDDCGFLNPPDQWDEDFAEGMARQLGILGGLTEAHWRFVRYLRKGFIVERAVPSVVHACMANGLSLNGLRRLFPMGYLRGACRIAGIDYDFICSVNFLVTYETDWSSYDTIRELGDKYELGACGFLKNFDEWDGDFAVAVSREWDLRGGLTDRHHEIIAFLRDFFAEHRRVPTLYETCKANSSSLKEFDEVFPSGYRRGACRAAGLPLFVRY